MRQTFTFVLNFQKVYLKKTLSSLICLYELVLYLLNIKQELLIQAKKNPNR